MNESDGYFVYFFPQALEALGEAIKPYLRDGAGGEHVRCTKIDTAGALIEMDQGADATHAPRCQRGVLDSSRTGEQLGVGEGVER